MIPLDSINDLGYHSQIEELSPFFIVWKKYGCGVNHIEKSG